MSNKTYRFHDGQKGAALTIRVTPRSSKNEIAEVLSDGTIKVRLVSPTASDTANQMLLTLLSEVLGVAESKIEIVAGTNGYDKLVSVLDLDANAVHKRILEHLA